MTACSMHGLDSCSEQCRLLFAAVHTARASVWHTPPPPLAATCLLLALKEWGWGWQHKPRDPWTGRNQGLGGCGWAALGMCGLYMWTGMSGLDDTALPMNPGAAFKLVDVAQKHKVWERWGYGDLGMR